MKRKITTHGLGEEIDMTPYYPHEEDFSHFHTTLKKAVNDVTPNNYLRYKRECDDYFTIKHRNEMRGIGGIFFDYLKDKPEKYFRLIKNIGSQFLSSYLPIVERRKQENFSKADKNFQLMRRGRYVEFNLVYDRGTLFGLKTNGRIESIFMSLPMHVSYPYNYQPPENTPHQTMSQYYQPKQLGSNVVKIAMISRFIKITFILSIGFLFHQLPQFNKLYVHVLKGAFYEAKKNLFRISKNSH